MTDFNNNDLKKILMIEDDVRLRESLKSGLEAEGYGVVAFGTAAEGIAAVRKDKDVNLVLLDLGLPDREGFEVLEEIRTVKPDLSVLILSGRGEVEDRVRGLEGGAEDYLTKPFAFAELLARVRLRLRRSPVVKTRYQCGEVGMDLLARRVLICGVHEELPPREYDLLCCLLRAEGLVVSREEIGSEVWNAPKRMTSLDNLIDVHIKRLRERLGEASGARIRTLRGVGYVLEERT